MQITEYLQPVPCELLFLPWPFSLMATSAVFGVCKAHPKMALIRPFPFFFEGAFVKA
jgi:hypothetical protein